MHVAFNLTIEWTPWDNNLLTKSKFACNLGTWRASLIWIILILQFTITLIILKIIPITSTTLSSPKYTLCGTISSYVWNAAPRGSMLANLWSTYTSHPNALHIALQMCSHHHLQCCYHYFAACSLPYSKNMQCGPICHNSSTSWRFCPKMDWLLCLDETSLRHCPLRVLSPSFWHIVHQTCRHVLHG